MDFLRNIARLARGLARPDVEHFGRSRVRQCEWGRSFYFELLAFSELRSGRRGNDQQTEAQRGSGY